MTFFMRELIRVLLPCQNCKGTIQCCKNLTHLTHLIKLHFLCWVCLMCHIITFNTDTTFDVDALILCKLGVQQLGILSFMTYD